MAIFGLVPDNALDSTLGLLVFVVVVIVLIAFLGFAAWVFINYKKHNIKVSIWRYGGEKGTWRKMVDRGRLFMNPETLQSSFHLFNRKVYVPNVVANAHIYDGEIELREIGNGQYVPMSRDFSTGNIKPINEVDLEFYADGIRRSLERKAGKPGFWDKYGLPIMGAGFLLIITFCLLFLFYQLRDVASGLMSAAESCRVFKPVEIPAQAGELPA